MPRNKTGGKQAKRLGNKTIQSSGYNKILRLCEDVNEKYAFVTKMCGNGMCIVVDTNNTEYMCFIRNKFRGRSKRDNFINVGAWILIGLREWETYKEGKRGNCDLLELYNPIEIEQLKQREKRVNWSTFITIMNNGGMKGGNSDADNIEDFTFSENANNTFETISMQSRSAAGAATETDVAKEELNCWKNEDNIINVDDI